MKTMDRLEEILRAMECLPDYEGIRIADVHTRDRYGATPLHVAATAGDCEAIRLLAAAGADLDAQGEHAHTPLMDAVQQGRTEAARLLVELGASRLPNDDGTPPSSMAALNKNPVLALWLRERGY